MINIGIYLSIPPDAGGAYQYNLSIIKALDSLDIREYRITAFSIDSSWASLLPTQFKQICIPQKPIHNLMRKIFKFIYRADDNILKFASLFNPVINAINASNCDLVIFPGQEDVSYQTTKPSLATIHDLMHRYARRYEEYQHGIYERREKHYKCMCRYVKGILVDSNVGKLHVIESYGVSEERVHVLPFVPPFYLSELSEVDVCAKYGLPERFIFFPAQFWEHKNHIKLIEALDKLHQRGHCLHLVLVGSKKNSYERVISRIAELELTKFVYVLGYVSNEEIFSLYKKADVMAFVSTIGPTNIPPIEALLLGCPLVVSNVYAMPEQVGDAALLVDPHNAADIADKIEMIIYNEELRNELVDKGYKIANSWNQELFNNGLVNIIQSIVSNK